MVKVTVFIHEALYAHLDGYFNFCIAVIGYFVYEQKIWYVDKFWMECQIIF